MSWNWGIPTSCFKKSCSLRLVGRRVKKLPILALQQNLDDGGSCCIGILIWIDGWRLNVDIVSWREIDVLLFHHLLLGGSSVLSLIYIPVHWLSTRKSIFVYPYFQMSSHCWIFDETVVVGLHQTFTPSKSNTTISIFLLEWKLHSR